MAKLGVHLQMTQSQVLKPQQILVSSLLQLPLLHLEQQIKAELEVNPALEEAEELEDLQEDLDEEIEENKEEAEEIKEEFDELEENNKSDEDKLNEEIQEDINVDDLLPSDDEDIPDPKMPRDRSKEEIDMPERYFETMSERLIEQLHMLNFNQTEHKIGEYIIYNLREDGYLDDEVSCEMIAQIFEVPESLVENVLKAIQRFDPVGIAARSLQECLLIQLDVNNRDGELDLPIRILRDAYHDFVNRRFERVADDLSVDIELIKSALAVIEKLNPKPGHGDGDVRLQYIVPDFFVRKVDDELIISLNEMKMPGLRISTTYKKMLRKPKELDREVKKFLKEKVDSAKWFIKAIRQRQQTMQKTMNAMVDRQFDFFDKGPAHIKPMIMKDIADMIEMDISTVSRVCKGKYVDTDYGIFELKYFFNEGMDTDDGESLSTLKIKDRLADIIEGENRKKPYSDEKLAKMLNDEGIPIARRTVAKYREQMDISVARLRREI